MQHPSQHEGRGRDRPQEEWSEQTPGLLSQSDPEPTRVGRRPPVWLIIGALVVVGFVAMHLSGAIK